MTRTVAALLALALVSCAAPADPAARLGRAVAAMERIDGMRFELRARVEAGGANVPGGPVVDEVQMLGEYASPDRLHVTVHGRGRRTDILLIGRRTWVDTGGGYAQSVHVPVGPLRDARAPITFLRGSGATSFAGLGLSRGAVTYRVRLELDAGDLAARSFEGQAVPPDARGTVEVEIGLFDDLIRRQTVEIRSSADPFTAGMEHVRTTYTVEYWAHGERPDIREPE